MAHFHVKTKNGRPYLYVREIARVDGKPKVISQIYIGGPDRVAEMARGPVESEPKQLKVEEFGALWLAMQADQDIDLAGIVDGVVERDKREKGPSVGEYFLYAALNRMVKAVSKKAMAGWYGKTSVQQIRPVDVAALTSQRYWEKWDRVSERALEKLVAPSLQDTSRGCGSWSHRQRTACCSTPPTPTRSWPARRIRSWRGGARTSTGGTTCAR